MSYLYQHSGKNISLATGSCLTAPIICGSTCVQSAQILGTKVSVGSLNASYDLYNNGTTYLNGAVTIDDSLTITGTRILKTGGYNKPGVQMTGTGNYCWTDLNIFLKNTTAANSAIFSDYEPHAEWGLFHDNTADAFYITAGSSTNNVGNFTIKNCAGTDRTTYIKHKFVQGDGLAEIGGRLSVSPDHSSSYNGIAIGCNYTNTGNWHSQLDVYGASHSVLRINHGCGTDGANNSRYNCIYAHCGNPFVMCSSGSIRLKPGSGTVFVCGTLCTGTVCGTSIVKSPIICGTTCVYSNCVYANNINADVYVKAACICTSTMSRCIPTWSLVGTRSLPQVTASANLPVGWHTIYVNTGNRSGGRFVLRDTTGSRHQYVVFYATHMYGSGNSINVLSYSRYNGQPIQCIRIKDFSTYDGAALQVYVCDAENNLVAYEAGDNIHSNGWYHLTQWCCDACVPYNYSCFNACWPAGCYCTGASVNLHCIQQGGQILTGKLYAPVICGTSCVQSAAICGTTCVRTACVHSTGNICGSEICSGSWFRNATSGGGLYNSVTGVHWYSSNACNMILYAGQCNNVSIIGQACGANRGCINWNCHNQFHIWDAGGNARILVNSTSDIRLCNTVCQYGNFVSTGRGYFHNVDEGLNFKGARGCLTNQYMHLYNKVGIGHPSGWGCGETDTPDKGLSTYGKACIGYGISVAADALDVKGGGVETHGDHGLTSGTYGNKFYPDNCAFWNVKAGGSSSNVGIRFRDSGGTIDGYLYADDGHIGFLDQASHWAYGHKNDACHWWNINNVTRMRLTDTELRLNSSGDNFAIPFRMNSSSTIRGYVYANCANNVGFLDKDGHWAIRHDADSATYWSINNSEKMQLTTTCLCHSGVICAASCMRTPIFCGTTCVRTPIVCSTDYVTAPNVLSNGANVTAMAQGCCFWRQFMVCGDADTFYPVCYFRGYTFGYKRYSINRSYNSTAPNTWYTSTHKGGLNYTWEQTSDTQWGGNDRSFRVNQVRETYTTVIGGHVHTVSGGIILLRGGGALYCYASDSMCTSCVCVYDGTGGTDSQGMTHSSCTYFCPGNCACVCALTCANAQTCRNSTICNTSAYPLQMAGTGNASATIGCFCVVRSAGHVCAVNNVCGACFISTTCVAGPVIKATNCVYACCGIDFVHSNWSGEKTKIQAHSTHLYFQNYNSGCFFFRNCHGSNIFSVACDGCLRAANCIRAASNICSDLGISGQSYVRSPGYLQTGNHIYAWTQTQDCVTFGVGNADGNGWIHPLKVYRCGTVVIDNLNRNSSYDAALLIYQCSNSDWSQIICKNAGAGTDYGLDLRMGATSTAAMYARFNNAIKFRLQYNCLCHDTMLKSPIVCATSVLKSSDWVCANRVCSTYYGDGSNLTGIGGGYCSCCNTTVTTNGTDCGNVYLGKDVFACGVAQGKTTGHYRNVAIGNYAMGGVGCDPHSNVVIGNSAGATPSCCRGCNGYCYNTYIGRNAGDGTFNGSIGGSAGSGSCNVMVGAYTGGSPHNGYNNVLIGTNSGYNMQCGASCNLFLGHGSGGAVTTGCKCVVIGYGYGGCYQNASICAACTHVATLNKSSGSFIIPHPDPAKTATTDLRHSYVESPTRGDNIYRWQVDVTNCCNVITLPSYYQFLNENDMVWVSPVEHFGSAYGKVTEDQCCAIICTNADGKYNVLLVGTRCDCMALNHWKGVEPAMESTSPALSAITEENPKGPDYPRIFVCNVRKPMSEW